MLVLTYHVKKNQNLDEQYLLEQTTRIKTAIYSNMLSFIIKNGNLHSFLFLNNYIKLESTQWYSHNTFNENNKKIWNCPRSNKYCRKIM